MVVESYLPFVLTVSRIEIHGLPRPVREYSTECASDESNDHAPVKQLQIANIVSSAESVQSSNLLNAGLPHAAGSQGMHLTATPAVLQLVKLNDFHAITILPQFGKLLPVHPSFLLIFAQDPFRASNGALLDRHKHVFWIYQTSNGFSFFTTRIKFNMNLLEALLANAVARQASSAAQGSANLDFDDFWIPVLLDEVKLSKLALTRIGVAGKVKEGVKQAVLQAGFLEFCDVGRKMKALIDDLVHKHRTLGVPRAVADFVERHRNEAWDLQGVT